MNTLLLKLIKKEKITNKDIVDELYEICDREHSSCNSECLVYFLNGNDILYVPENGSGCDCFKNGREMLKFIKERL